MEFSEVPLKRKLLVDEIDLKWEQLYELKSCFFQTGSVWS